MTNHDYEDKEVVHEDYPDEIFQVETEMESGTLIIHHLGEPEDVPEEDHTIHAQPSRVELKNEPNTLENMDDEELAETIVTMDENSERFNDAVSEAKSRGYETLEELNG